MSLYDKNSSPTTKLWTGSAIKTVSSELKVDHHQGFSRFLITHVCTQEVPDEYQTKIVSSCQTNIHSIKENHEFQPLSDKPPGGISWKLQWLLSIHHKELYVKQKQSSVSYKINATTERNVRSRYSNRTVTLIEHSAEDESVHRQLSYYQKARVTKFNYSQVTKKTAKSTSRQLS